MRRSVAIDGGTELKLAGHLLREDGDEDLCFSTWRPSTGYDRLTAILGQPIMPLAGERAVHGNASFTAAYALRAAQEAARAGAGLAFMHSHPTAGGWQTLNPTDQLAESRIANLAREITGLPLVGLIMAGDRGWSARFWIGVGRYDS
jgi:molybdopterin-synthase adenylyltransferase